MIVSVRLFAAARDAAAVDGVTVELPEPATIADLRRRLTDACPALRMWGPHLLFAVNCQYATDATPIDAGAELAAFPPVSGG